MHRAEDLYTNWCMLKFVRLFAALSGMVSLFPIQDFSVIKLSTVEVKEKIGVIWLVFGAKI